MTIGFFFLLWYIYKLFEKPVPRHKIPKPSFKILRKNEPPTLPNIEYIFNGKSIGKPLLLNAIEILGLTQAPRLSIARVNEAFKRQAELAIEDQEHGYKVKTTIQDLQAAKAYVLDWGNYVYSYN